MRVQPATPADFARVAELTAGVYRDEGLAPEEYQRELRDVAGRASRAELLVARDGEAVVGRAAGRRRAPPGGPPGAGLAAPRDGEAIVGSVALVLDGDFREISDADDEAAFR